MQVRPSNRPTCVQKADLVWVILSERQTSVKLRMAWLSSASRTSRALWSHPDRLEGLTPHACFFCCSLKLQFLRNLSSFLKSKRKRLMQSPLKAHRWGFLNLIRLFISNFLLLWVKSIKEKNKRLTFSVQWNFPQTSVYAASSADSTIYPASYEVTQAFRIFLLMYENIFLCERLECFPCAHVRAKHT